MVLYICISEAGPFQFWLTICQIMILLYSIHNSLPLKHMPKSVLLRLSRLQYGPDLFPYGLIDDVDVLRHAFFITRSSIKQYKGSLENYPTIHSWIVGTSEPPITKISSLHLRHLTIKSSENSGSAGLIIELGSCIHV